MKPAPPAGREEGSSPLTDAEERRVAALLASVSTATLLRSLARLEVDNADARLIIAALLHRFPAT